MADVTDLLRDESHNAVAAWVIVGLLVAVAASELAFGDVLWAGFAATVAVIALLPPALFGHRRAMVPAEILLVAALPVIGRAFSTVPVTGNLATYLSVAALALIVALELHTFTPVRMTPRFAVVFVAIATMATAGVWAVVRWLLDLSLGTTFLLRPGVTEHAIEEALMWEFVASTVAGVGAGLLFAYYVGRRIGPDRVPREVRSDETA